MNEECFSHLENNQEFFGNQIEYQNSLPPLKQIGLIIKGAREQKNISVEELAESIRIGSEQLIALEAGNESALPERVFIKGMIKRLSERLQLNENDVMKHLKEQDLSALDKKTEEEQEKSENNLSKINIKHKKTKIFFAGGFVLLLGLCIFNFILSNWKNKSPDKLLPNNNEKTIYKKPIEEQSNTTNQSKFHIVSKGQTLSFIAKKNQVSLKELQFINKIKDPNRIGEGQKLI
tara:strand:+ start:2907 stop:3608 length:702 start_codon:yes stop_codon:yes gene_type:complete